MGLLTYAARLGGHVQGQRITVEIVLSRSLTGAGVKAQADLVAVLKAVILREIEARGGCADLEET